MFLPNLNIAKRPIPFSPCIILPLSVVSFSLFRFNLSGVAGFSQCFFKISSSIPHPSSSIIIFEVDLTEKSALKSTKLTLTQEASASYEFFISSTNAIISFFIN